MMDSDEKCVHCDATFLSKKKGYMRQSLDANLPRTSTTAFKVLEKDFNLSASPSKPRYLCSSCSYALSSYHKTKSALEDKTKSFFEKKHGNSYFAQKMQARSPATSVVKRRRIAYTPGKKKTPKHKQQVQSFRTKAINQIKVYRYRSAFKSLFYNSSVAKQAMIAVVTNHINTELKLFRKRESEAAKRVTIDNMENFCWPKLLKEANEEMPVTLTMVKTMVAKQVERKSVTPSIPVFGCALMTILRARDPRKFTFLAGCNSIQMWKSGCSERVFSCFHKMGLCYTKPGTVKLVDRIKEAHNHEIVKWKENIQNQMSGVQQHEGRPATARCLFGDDSGTGTNETEIKDYSVAWDNVQIQTTARHQGTAHSNKMLMWAMCYAASNRVSSYESDETTVQATSLPLQIFLPDKDAIDDLRMRMEVLVTRIICANFSHFQTHYGECVIHHIQHDHSQESARRSEIVNLGVVEENPSTLAGVILILDHLHQYVPKNGDEFHTILCHGDGLSVERHIDAQRARAGATTTAAQLKGLEPMSQEFHKRGILLQDIMDEFFSGKSAADRGTLAHIKNVFNHRNVSSKVMDCYNHTVDFLKFVTEGLVCLLVMKQLGLQTTNDQPPSSPFDSSLEERSVFLQNIAKNIVEEIWQQSKTEELEYLINNSDDDDDDDGGEEDEFPYCFCGEDVGGTMIECSNAMCSSGQWFHLPCVMLNEETLPDENDAWFCTNTCRDNAVPKHLKDCTNTNHDHVYNYSCALVWKCLNDLARHDAVKENDGPAMVKYWKLDMIEFWKSNHFKYMILGHRLLSGVNGWLPARIRHDMIWNRTVNLNGGYGRNIPMDLQTEFLNNEFKECLKHSRGRYTDEQVKRISQMGGSFGKAVNKLYESNVAETYVRRSVDGKANYKFDIQKFVSEYKDDNLFSVTPGRKHSGFSGYHCNMNVNNACGLIKRLAKYSSKLDKSRVAAQ